MIIRMNQVTNQMKGQLYCSSAATRALHVDHEASPLVPLEGDMI